METDIKKVMQRAMQKEELVIGFLGGSITQGSLASNEKKTYAYLVYEWWCRSFPEATFHYVNAGIGGTTSYFGVARAEKDFLMYRPDFAIVDFSVNDEPNEFFMETYEGLIRKLLKAPSHPAVLALCNAYYKDLKTAEDYHARVLSYYQIPYVSIRKRLMEMKKDNAYQPSVLSPDGLHPNDLGHKKVAEDVIAMLEGIKEKVLLEEAVQKKELPGIQNGRMKPPYQSDRYEKTSLWNMTNSSPILQGFIADYREKAGHLDFFKNGWIGRKKEDAIVFHVHCRSLAIQYKKSVKHPAKKAVAILDNDENNKIFLDGNFEENWGDCLYLTEILHENAAQEHELRIVIEDETSPAEPFYLLAIITA